MVAVVLMEGALIQPEAKPCVIAAQDIFLIYSEDLVLLRPTVAQLTTVDVEAIPDAQL